MKLYTYFRAMELARSTSDSWVNDETYEKRKFSQYFHLRDGLIKRMERIEMKIKELEDRENFWKEEYYSL